MSKTITSPVKRWPGTVIISDPLTYPQLITLDDALANLRATAEGDFRNPRARVAILPGILACVEEWHLDSDFTPNPFPATPLKSSAELIFWLAKEITALYEEAEEPTPNE